MKMRNDKDFRKNCEILANDIVEESMAWRISLEEPQDWHCRIDNFGHLQAAALLYIAANMPNFNDEKKKQEIGKCSLCSRGKIVLRSFESEKTDEAFTEVFTDLLFDPKNRTLSINNDIAGFIGPMNIAYCPMCGRKL